MIRRLFWQRATAKLLLTTILLFTKVVQRVRASILPTYEKDDMCTNKWEQQETKRPPTNNNNNNNNNINHINDPDVPNECGLYLAPSTIPNAGLGVFTSKSLKQGDKVGNGDIAIPIVDQNWHMGVPYDFNGDEDELPYFSPFHDYIWQGWAVGMQSESDDRDPDAVTTFWPGLDSAINCKIEALNTDPPTSPLWDTGNLHRSKDPGAGAITPYHNGSTYTTLDIPVGGELFKYYGDSWFHARSEIFGEDILLPDDWKPAQEIIDIFHELSNEHFGHVSSTTKDDIDKDLWSIISRMPYDKERESEPHIGVLPKRLEEARLAAEKGLPILYQNESRRPIEELKKVGRCMDYIEPKPSVLVPQAGRGAFATRFIPKGTIITGSPLLHVPHKEPFINIYASYQDENGNYHRVEPDEIIGKQLLINYCWGHPQSTMILCPYGSGIGYINHNQTLSNVKMQWSPNGIVGQQEEWLNKTIQDFVSDSSGKVSHVGMDIVATHDIQKGEEIFLNYGQEWEDAWMHHVQHWKPVEGADEYESASLFNDNGNQKHIPIRNKYEQEYDPYPSNVVIRCHSMLSEPHLNNEDDDNENDEITFNFEWPLEEEGVECVIQERHKQDDGTFLYDIYIAEGFVKMLYSMERDSFRFFDLPYTRDHNLENVFRHEIGIPDDIFPPQWKNDV